MEIQSAFTSGVQGFQNATEKSNQAAADIAASTLASEENAALTLEQNIEAPKPQPPSPSLTESAVDLKVAEYQAKSSVEVIKTADETLGTLLDVRV